MNIGFTNGCFDILHVGHLSLFEHLKKQVDYVIVGIDSDKMVKKAKGNDRPINNEKDRKFFLEKIRDVDEVFIFDSHDELRSALSKIKPNYMLVGSDYKNREVIGSEHAKLLDFFEVIDGYSTTKILQYTPTRG
jgi:D-beta-D-heptose 7-phosphate kinase/D-beta-D-heptose 1-phosphate adenosyltransferase